MSAVRVAAGIALAAALCVSCAKTSTPVAATSDAPAATSVSKSGATGSRGTAPEGTAPGASRGASDTAFFGTVEKWALHTVGCTEDKDGAVVGPETDAAILAFQEGAHLTPTGEYDPATAAALDKATGAKKQVCSSPVDPGVAAPAPSPDATAAPCTATALLSALPPGTVIREYVCASANAAVAMKEAPYAYFLTRSKTEWTNPIPARQHCNNTDVNYPPMVRQLGCLSS